MKPSDLLEIAPDEAAELLELLIEAVEEFDQIGVRIGVPMSHAQHQYIATRDAGLILAASHVVGEVRRIISDREELRIARQQAAQDQLYEDGRFGG